jgi:sugar transferase (PEP-CTERM system associated)
VLRRRLLVVGAGRRAWDLALMLRREGRNLRYDITFLHLPSAGEADPRLLRDVPGCRDLDVSDRDILHVARKLRADQIAVAPDERRGMELQSLLACKTAGFPVMGYLTFIEREIRRIDVKRMEVGWLLYSDGFYFGALDRMAKRVLDVLVSALLLLVLAPALLAGMAMVWLGDRGPVFYRQDRITRSGAVFCIRKLRTMRVDAERHGAVWAADGDRRITRVGQFLRRSRIDEIPQLFNVLAGDMSLVGPRPERPSFVRLLSEQIPLYCERHRVKAGLTGWAQVNYPYGASIDDARSKLSYDLYYVKNFSVLFDLLIILQTIRVVLWPGGVR